MRHVRRPHLLLAGFLTFSLLLHLLVLLLLPRDGILPPAPAPEPVYVEVVPPQPKPQERELDLEPPQTPAPPRTTPAKRLGAQDQQVARETAPRGEAPEDRRGARSAPPAVAAPARPAPRPQSPPSAATPEPARPLREGAAAAPAQPAAPAPPARDLPDLQALLKLPQATVSRLEDQWREKYRKDVDAGTAVWLDTEKDLLVSFFKRFRDRIYGVWNYPVRSRDRGEQGTSLLRITVLRDGTLVDVKLLESSGYPLLDAEAVAAVRKAAPFGPLARSYEEESLTIFAFFRYTLTGRRIH